jgi:hypothetical protein
MHDIISSYLYMDHTCFKHMTFVCKRYEPMKEQFFCMISITRSWDEKFVNMNPIDVVACNTNYLK